MTFTTLISVLELRRCLERSATPTFVMLDCRFDLSHPDAGRAAYLAGHIPGAQYADLNRDLAAPMSSDSGRHPLPAPDVLAKRFSAFGIASDVQVIAYDAANGSFAARVWWLLRWLGHRQVAVLDGGYRAWLAAGGGTESGDRPGLPQCFVPRVDAAAAVSSAEVLDALRDPGRLIVDARAAERYSGQSEPIDPVAGHVSGAVNHPFADNLDADGRFLAPTELRRRWLERLAGKAPDDAIMMCGSGVTACHHILALEVAGLPGAKLYSGSFSEWIRDPARPVTLGNAP